MTRIVNYVHRYKRPPRKRPKAAALAGPAIIATNKSRRPLGGQAAAEAGHSIAPSDGAAQPSTPRDAARDRDVTPPPANDERKPAIVTTTSRKRLRLLRAEEPPAQRDDDSEAAARMRAWLERAKWGHGPSR
jgi:hypothetical protein